MTEPYGQLNEVNINNWKERKAVTLVNLILQGWEISKKSDNSSY